jgi:hypothetical protein
MPSATAVTIPIAILIFAAVVNFGGAGQETSVRDMCVLQV